MQGISGGVSPSLSRFYRADARSAEERALGFQVARILSRSNVRIMGEPGCTGYPSTM